MFSQCYFVQQISPEAERQPFSGHPGPSHLGLCTWLRVILRATDERLRLHVFRLTNLSNSA